jgi:glycine C-acetyltransferase
LEDLRAQLEATKELNDGAGARRTVIVTDGVFSMDGYLAPLPQICDLADEFGALVLVDDSHAVGFMGATGAGTPEHFGVSDRVDIYTGTFGKALGGASGGYVSSHREIVQMLRQKARPYLFSNSLAPMIVASTLKALELVHDSGDLREKLFANAALFRSRMAEEGFDLLPGEHAIIPVMFGDARIAAQVADAMLDQGVFVTAFSFPVVPRGKARIRVQLSAAHSEADVETCVRAFVAARAAVAG